MKNICLLNGSPKGKNGVSLHFLEKLNQSIDSKKYTTTFINAKGSRLEADFKIIENADVLVISFPLYIYCLPGMLMRYLEDYSQYVNSKEKSEKTTEVYAIVNCGFPNPEICNNALRVIKNFCQRTNLHWRFGIAVGMGGILAAGKNSFLINKLSSTVYRSIGKIKKDIEKPDEGRKEDYYVSPHISKGLVRFLINKSWSSKAKENGLTRKDLHGKPYYNYTCYNKLQQISKFHDALLTDYKKVG